MKWIGLFVFAVAILVSISAGNTYRKPTIETRSTRKPTYTPTPTPAFTSTPTRMPTPKILPVRLIVPKLTIDTTIESVGMTEKGNMDVPKDAQKVGWFRYGPTPSVRGNAVISGHYDTPTGRPAIFYYLDKLSIGDSVMVELSDGTTHEFVVTGKDLLSVDTFPGKYVFATKFGINLNLITCGGVWDPKLKNYDKRLVIFTTKKGSEFKAL